MKAARSFAAEHAGATFFVLVFAISWGGVAFTVGAHGFPSTPAELERLLPFAIAAMLAGPSVVAVLLTVFIDGRAGLRACGARLVARAILRGGVK